MLSTRTIKDVFMYRFNSLIPGFPTRHNLAKIYRLHKSINNPRGEPNFYV